MFCEECGHKNSADAEFCEECGKKLEIEEVKHEKKSTTKKSKPLSKKQKIIGIVCAVIVVLLIVGYNILTSITDPKNIAKDYFEAFTSGDASKMYNYLKIDNSSKLTTEKVFKAIYKDNYDVKDFEVSNYNVKDVRFSDDGLITTVEFSYILKGESESDTATVELIKNKNKKYLFFDDWEINGLDVISDISVSVFKGASLTVGGVAIDSSYIDKKLSDDEKDVYVLPDMFELTYDVVVKFPMGYSLTSSITPSSYYKDKELYFDEDDLSDDEIKSLEKTVNTNINNLYENVINGKSYDDIKKDYEYNGSLDDLAESYTDFKEDIDGRSKRLTSFKTTSVEISSIDVDSDTGALEVYFKYKYDYSISYTYSGNDKTSSDDDYGYAYMYFGYDKDSYKLVDFYSLSTYFY